MGYSTPEYACNLELPESFLTATKILLATGTANKILRSGGMESIRFAPVKLRIAHRKELRVVSSVQQAWELLAEEWPEGETKERNKALTICEIALRGKASADVARAAFIEAAKKAGIY